MRVYTFERSKRYSARNNTLWYAFTIYEGGGKDMGSGNKVIPHKQLQIFSWSTTAVEESLERGS